MAGSARQPLLEVVEQPGGEEDEAVSHLRRPHIDEEDISAARERVCPLLTKEAHLQCAFTEARAVRMDVLVLRIGFSM